VFVHAGDAARAGVATAATAAAAAPARLCDTTSDKHYGHCTYTRLWHPTKRMRRTMHSSAVGVYMVALAAAAAAAAVIAVATLLQ
jgi:hypothetical protein